MSAESGYVSWAAAQQWRRRPTLSLVLRLSTVVVPAALAMAVSITLAHLLPRPLDTLSTVLWWVAITATTATVLIAAERCARRLLPLAALLNLALVFPDRTPSRFAVARQAWRPHDLRAQLAEASAEGGNADPSMAQRVLELVAALSVHDRCTRGHSERVRVFTDLIANEVGLSREDKARLRWAALLHDVGKVMVSHRILNKPGRPTPSEWTLLRQHPTEGARLIAPIAPWLGAWAATVQQHHERYDGNGYPHRLTGDQICRGARIIAVADAYEVMTAARPYKRPMSPSSARAELVLCAGTHFDPTVVRAFLQISMGRLWRATGFSAILSQIPLLPQVATGVERLGPQLAPTAATGATMVALVVGGGVAGSPEAAASSSATGSPPAPAGAPSEVPPVVVPQVGAVGSGTPPVGPGNATSVAGSAASGVAPPGMPFPGSPRSAAPAKVQSSATVAGGRTAGGTPWNPTQPPPGSAPATGPVGNPATGPPASQSSDEESPEGEATESSDLEAQEEGQDSPAASQPSPHRPGDPR